MSKIPLFHNLIASGFGSGYSPIAPGTAGALDMHLYLMITTKHYNVHFYLFAYLLF